MHRAALAGGWLVFCFAAFSLLAIEARLMTPTWQIITATATATVLHDALDAQVTTPGKTSQSPPPACRTLQPGQGTQTGTSAPCVRSNLAARCSSQASKQSRSRTSGQLRPSGLAPCQGATMAALARLRRQVDQCTADCVQAENALIALRARFDVGASPGALKRRRTHIAAATEAADAAGERAEAAQAAYDIAMANAGWTTQQDPQQDDGSADDSVDGDSDPADDDSADDDSAGDVHVRAHPFRA
eukprot:COSAG06_NODE_11588_length_1488_cov_1.395248_2_plen_245_part_00